MENYELITQVITSIRNPPSISIVDLFKNPFDAAFKVTNPISNGDYQIVNLFNTANITILSFPN